MSIWLYNIIYSTLLKLVIFSCNLLTLYTYIKYNTKKSVITLLSSDSSSASLFPGRFFTYEQIKVDFIKIDLITYLILFGYRRLSGRRKYLGALIKNDVSRRVDEERRISPRKWITTYLATKIKHDVSWRADEVRCISPYTDRVLAVRALIYANSHHILKEIAIRSNLFRPMWNSRTRNKLRTSQKLG